MADCNCDDSIALRAELATVTAERDYLLTACSPSEIRQMRAELAKEYESRVLGALPEELQSDFEEVIG
jgi:hypothetical protein